MKQIIVALFAGSVALSSLSVLAADTTAPVNPPAETRTEQAKDYVKDKSHKAKVATKKAGKKAKRAVKNRKTTEPASVSESRPDATPAK